MLRNCSARPPRRPILVLTLLLAGGAGCGERHARIDLKEAPERRRAQSLTLDGGRIRFDAGGRYERICTSHAPQSKGASGCVDHYFYVFPVVPLDPASSADAPAWVTCTEREKSLEACEANLRSRGGEITGEVAIRLGEGNPMSGWEKAADDAAKRHGLRNAAHGPVLRLRRP